jgi:20S proteasome subunit beta 1
MNLQPLPGVSRLQSDAPHTGTSIMACLYPGGVVLGADGRVSTGNYISNRASNKIGPLSEHTYLLRSGSAADAQIISDHGRRWAMCYVPRLCLWWVVYGIRLC